MQNREIIIGDVHGCIDELRDLISTIQPTQGDHLVFVGDLIDKGAASSQVIDFVQTIGSNTCKVTLLLGNHEEKLLRWVEHEQRRVQQGIPNPITDRSGALNKLVLELREDQLETLASALLWTRLDRQACFPQLLIVHAGIEPALLQIIDSDKFRLNLSSNRWRELEGLIRVRFVNDQGKRIPLGDQQPKDQFWAEVYDGRFGFVVYGHEPSMTGSVRLHSNALGIDLGCVYGGHLAAAIFHTDRSVWQTATVRARRSYVMFAK